jgi:ribulose-5-phosphate 4-epimerase/fuculose-1-phosphate aldolase
MLVSSPQLGASLASTLGGKQIVLMRRHGATMTGQSIKHAVYRAIHAMPKMQIDAMQMGDVTFLTDEEAMNGMRLNDRSASPVTTMWSRHCRRIDPIREFYERTCTGR